jgi:hypothetical protein
MPALHDLLQPVLGRARRGAAPQRRALAAALLLEDAADPVDPRQVALACRSLLAARPGEVLLAIDDWQWLDAATSAVLTFVLRRLEAGGAKVIATVRSGEADDALAALVHALPEGHALELAVAPLEAPALAALVHARTGGGWRRPRSRACTRLRGQPLDGARADPRAGGGHRDGRAAAARPPDRRAPTRLARARRVVAALAEPTVDGVGETGSSCARRRRLVRDGRRLRFSHPLIAAVVEERTPPCGVARDPRPACPRGAHSRAARAPSRRRGDGPDEAGRRGARGGRGARRRPAGAPIAAAELGGAGAAALTPDAECERRVDRLLAAADAGDQTRGGPGRPEAARGGARARTPAAGSAPRAAQARVPGHGRQRARLMASGAGRGRRRRLLRADIRASDATVRT